MMSIHAMQVPPRRGVTLQALIPIRREPSESSEMVSQLLFGEKYQVLEDRGKWLQVLTEFDYYTGWIDSKVFIQYTVSAARTLPEEAIQAARVAEVHLSDGTAVMTPAGCSLPGYDPERNTIDVQGVRCPVSSPYGSIVCRAEEDMVQTARQFMNAPYVWGGRSPFGFDCSGFVQTVYHIHHVSLPRDASQQSESGERVNGVQHARLGDLAFFYGEKGGISHVGLLDGAGHIIHCSGRVRIDPIEDTGILHASTGVLTHPMAFIRRII
jgi:gamma-D-glutamyl-L-lysine dipeptidyl-peptidase